MLAAAASDVLIQETGNYLIRRARRLRVRRRARSKSTGSCNALALRSIRTTALLCSASAHRGVGIVRSHIFHLVQAGGSYIIENEMFRLHVF
eukprot:SAG11_NODE_2425_length_3378_cov_2.513118_5_plen_92_part_00